MNQRTLEAIQRLIDNAGTQGEREAAEAAMARLTAAAGARIPPPRPPTAVGAPMYGWEWTSSNTTSTASSFNINVSWAVTT